MDEIKFDKGITVLICTYNGSKRLFKTLDALKGQTGIDNIDWEVIVIDNASDDHTGEISKEIWGNCVIPFKVLVEPIPGKTNAMRRGIKYSKYEYIIIVDDDNWLFPDYIQKAYEIMENDLSIAVLGGKGEPVFECPITPGLEQFEPALAVGSQLNQEYGYLTSRNYLYGAGSVIRKKYYCELIKQGHRFFLADRTGKKFTSGGDDEICIALKLCGYNLYYSSSLKFKHEISKDKVTRSSFIKLYRSFGKSEFVSDQYKLYGNMHLSKGVKVCARWYAIYVAYILYTIIKQYFRFFIFFNNKKKRSRIFFLINLKHAKLLFGICNFKLFCELHQSLKNAIWIKSLTH